MGCTAGAVRPITRRVGRRWATATSTPRWMATPGWPTPRRCRMSRAAPLPGFIRRARVFFAAHGITDIQRVITDNGACYRSQAFASAAHPHRTPPHPPLPATDQRKNRALPGHSRDRARLRPLLGKRNRMQRLATTLEHPLQLSPRTHRDRRPTTRISGPAPRQQPPDAEQLAPAKPPTAEIRKRKIYLRIAGKHIRLSMVCHLKVLQRDSVCRSGRRPDVRPEAV